MWKKNCFQITTKIKCGLLTEHHFEGFPINSPLTCSRLVDLKKSFKELDCYQKKKLKSPQIYYVSSTVHLNFPRNYFLCQSTYKFPKKWLFMSSAKVDSYVVLVSALHVAKGQLISERIFEVIVSPKIWTKNCQDFCPV